MNLKTVNLTLSLGLWLNAYLSPVEGALMLFALWLSALSALLAGLFGPRSFAQSVACVLWIIALFQSFTAAPLGTPVLLAVLLPVAYHLFKPRPTSLIRNYQE